MRIEHCVHPRNCDNLGLYVIALAGRRRGFAINRGALMAVVYGPIQEIVGTKAADHSAKWHAAVQLKNCVVKYWRKRLNAA